VFEVDLYNILILVPTFISCTLCSFFFDKFSVQLINYICSLLEGNISVVHFSHMVPINLLSFLVSNLSEE
jgi:hypothetical protein